MYKDNSFEYKLYASMPVYLNLQPLFITLKNDDHCNKERIMQHTC
jgi:hypothetical protein